MGIKGISGIEFTPTAGSELVQKVNSLLEVYTLEGVGSLMVTTINDPSYGDSRTIQISPRFATPAAARIEKVYLSLLSSPEGKVVRATPDYLDLWFNEERYRIRYQSERR